MINLENIKLEASREYDKLQFRDDFLFCKILESNPDIAKELIELILNIKIKKVKVKKQDEIEITADGRGIRLDVMAEDESNTVYDIEMQTTKQSSLPKRTRYYQGMIDLNQIERGATFNKLKKSFVIFICMDDPFDRKRFIYTFSNICKEDKTLELGDDCYKVFLNTKGSVGNISKDLKDVLNLIRTGHGESDLSSKIMALVDKARVHTEWRQSYMTLYMRDLIKLEEGRKQNRIETIEKALKKGRTIEDIADFMDCSVDEIKKIVDELPQKVN